MPKLRSVGWSGHSLPANASSFVEIEQEDVVDRQNRPQKDRDADQQQLRFGPDLAQRTPAAHRESLFIMKYTIGSTSGIAQTMVAIARLTWSRRR